MAIKINIELPSRQKPADLHVDAHLLSIFFIISLVKEMDRI